MQRSPDGRGRIGSSGAQAILRGKKGVGSIWFTSVGGCAFLSSNNAVSVSNDPLTTSSLEVFVVFPCEGDDQCTVWPPLRFLVWDVFQNPICTTDPCSVCARLSYPSCGRQSQCARMCSCRSRAPREEERSFSIRTLDSSCRESQRTKSRSAIGVWFHLELASPRNVMQDAQPRCETAVLGSSEVRRPLCKFSRN